VGQVSLCGLVSLQSEDIRNCRTTIHHSNWFRVSQ